MSRTDVELGGVELRGQVDIELAKQVDVELAREVDVEVGKDVDIEAEPVRVDTKLDTSGNDLETPRLQPGYNQETNQETDRGTDPDSHVETGN